jgi:hypothetical protein
MSQFKIIGFVGYHNNRLARLAQYRSNTVVQIGQPVGNIHYKQNYIRLFNSNAYLFIDFVLHHIIGVYNPTAGIDDRKFLSSPLNFAILAITSGAGCFAHNCPSSLCQSIEQSRFAHIGASHDSYYILHKFLSDLFMNRVCTRKPSTCCRDCANPFLP